MKNIDQMIDYLEFSISFYSEKLIEYENINNQYLIEHSKSVISTYENTLKYMKED